MMELRRVLALRGPNIWARFPVLEAWVDLGRWWDCPAGALAEAIDRLKVGLSTTVDDRQDDGPDAGLAERFGDGVDLAHALGHVALELQRRLGSAVDFVRTKVTDEPGVYQVVVRYEEEALGREAISTARALIHSALEGSPFDAEGTLARLRDLYLESRLGPSTGAIVEAARARGIPARRLNAASLVAFGWGVKQRRILAAETDRTGAIAEWIAKDKQLTRELLLAAGVPVPRGRPVEDEEDAWAAAEEIGPPVVVKPQHGNQGRGVAVDLSTCEQAIEAYRAAREEGSEILVEQFAPGDDYRLLVVGGRLVAASRREPAQVVGDGQTTIAGLVDRVNLDPRRDGHATPLSLIRLDAIALGVLAEQGYAPDSVPPLGQRVLIRRNANLSTGGTATDVTDEVHPEVAARAIEAAAVVGLDVAGIDVLAGSIGIPLEDQRGAIVEVNAAPGLRMHVEPTVGRPRPVGEAIVGLLFPEGADGRIPLVAVTGVNGKTTVTRLMTHLLASSGLTVGMTCTDGIEVAGRTIEIGDCSGPASARAVLGHPFVEAAVLETARGGILRAGLGFDRCDVAVVTNIGEGDHLGLAGIHTVEGLARVKRTVVEAVSPSGAAVLNADDRLVAEMAAACPGEVIYVSQGEESEILRAHLASGQRAVFPREGRILLAEGRRQTPLVELADVPLTLGGRIGFQVENTLAAAAAAWALGLPDEVVAAGLRTFGSESGHVPGRFHAVESNGATVIVDYGHNPSAVAALIDAVRQLPEPRRTIAFTAAGDRRDEDLLRQGELIGGAFDRVVLYEGSSLRGRPAGEVIAVLRRGLERGTRASDVLEAHGEADAITLALRGTGPGDLVVLQSDESARKTLDLLRSLIDRPGKDGNGSIGSGSSGLHRQTR
jgi:cyanophycin synthetase